MVYHRDNVARALLDLGAKENVPLSELVSFRVGGPAAFTLQPKDEWVLCRALNLCRDEHIPVILLGNGTNVLPSDEGFSGLILQMRRCRPRLRGDEGHRRRGLLPDRPRQREHPAGAHGP